MSIKRLLQLSSFALTALALQSFDTWGHQRIQLEDVQIHFRYSDGGKTPLLLVHGAPQHSHTWTHIGPILAEKFTVIAPDNRGMGSSSLSTTDNYTAAAGGKDLRAVLNFLNITKVPVLAHDKGVGLAASLAFESPTLSIVLSSPNTHYLDLDTRPMLHRLACTRTGS